MINQSQIVDFLTTCLICQKLKNDDLRTFASYCRIKKYQLGEIVLEEFDKTEETNLFYIVFQGTLHISKKHSIDQSHKNMLINIIKQGESFGEIGLIKNDSHRSATVTCLTETTLLAVNKSDFLTFYNNNIIFVQNVVEIIVSFLMHSNNLTKYIMFSTRNASCRLAYLLDFLKDKFAEQYGENSYQINLPFKSSLLAEFLGMKTQLFSRCKKELVDCGLISGYGKTIIIDDYSKFKSYMAKALQ